LIDYYSYIFDENNFVHKNGTGDDLLEAN